MEPLVDAVEGSAVISNCQPLLELNIATCTKEDLSFEADVKLEMRRDDNMHAFVSFFDVSFSLPRPVVIRWVITLFTCITSTTILLDSYSLLFIDMMGGSFFIS